MDRKACLEGFTCTSTLLPDGTVSGIVRLHKSGDGRMLSADELDARVATFPIEPRLQARRPA